jgi:hypothetical protein
MLCRFTGGKRSALLAIVQAMSETSSNATPPMPGSTRDETSDLQALAQVEKWMAIIREISHERAPTIIPSDDPSAKE